MVVGKDGRAETPTDPAPLDMIETVVNLHPKEFWPKRRMRYPDAIAQAEIVLQSLLDAGLIKLPALPPDRSEDEAAQRKALVDPATMNALTRLDKTLRQVRADAGP